MNIFVTGHSSRHGGGVSVARNLFSAFGRVAPKHDYFFTIPPDIGYEECCRVASKHDILVYQTSGLAQRWYWETVNLPAIVRKFRPNVIFNVSNRGLVSPPCPQATLIQDTHLLYPRLYFGRISGLERFKFWYHRRHLRKSLKATQLLFCQTQVAEQRLRGVYGNGFLIRHCANQFSTFVRPAEETASEPELLRPFSGKFKLFVLTRYYTHKNLEIIPRLFRVHRHELRDVGVVLTIAPDQHRNAAKLLRDVKRHGLEQNIITVGPLRQDELPVYYEHTDALLLPTLLESFSGTYLEAMQFGRPILTSDMDFAHVVCGDAALYFDPHNVDDICETILRLKNDSDLCQKLVKEGKTQRQVQSLTWDEIGQSVIRELELLVENAGQRNSCRD